MNPDVYSLWLQSKLEEAGAVAGTIHLCQGEGLALAASVNIPPPVIQAVQWVPQGKGMAGLAMQRRQPVSTCNLKEDRSGDVRPGARAVDAQAAVALPLLDDQGEAWAVVGFAFLGEEAPPTQALEALAATLPRQVAAP